MTIEEAMEWCVVHHATVEFTTFYSIDRWEREVVLTPAYFKGIAYTGSADLEGLISCVQRAQRAIWDDWKYQRDFARAPRPVLEGAAVEPESQNVQ